MSARRSRLMDGLFREQLHDRRAPLSGSPPPPPSSSSSTSPSDLRQTLAAAASPPPSSQPPLPPPDLKPLPSVLLLPPQGDNRRVAPTDRRYLIPETLPPPSLSYNGSSGAMMTAAIAAIKADELPSRPSSSGWPGGGGCTSASESTRDSDEDLDDAVAAELSVAGVAAMATLVAGAADARTSSSSFAAAVPATGGRHVCTICGTTFTMLGNLNRHKKSHMNVRPYNCNFCTRGFLRRTSYVEHVRLHTGEKPYLCLACGQSFVRKKCFQTHAKCCPGGSGIVTDVVAAAGSIVGLATSGSSAGSCSAGGHGLAGSCNGSCESGYAAANVTSAIDLASGRCDTAVVDAPATAAVSDPLQRAVRSTMAMATVCDQRDGLDTGRPQAAAIAHTGAAYGSRFLVAKPLVRHQAGIGRTSFSIMKRARSTQLSRWKKQHLMALARPLQSAAPLPSSGGSSTSLAAPFASSNRGNGSLLHRAVLSVGRRGAAQLALSGSGDKRHTEQSRGELLSPEGLSSAPLLPPPPPPTDPFSKSTFGGGGSTAAATAAQHSPSRIGSAVAVPSSLSSVCHPTASLPEQSPGGGDANVPAGMPSHHPISSPVPCVAPAAGAVGLGPLGLASSPTAMAANVSLPLRSPSAATGCSSTGTGSPAVAAAATAAATATAGVAGIMESSAALLPRDVKLFHCMHCDIYFANLVTFLLHRGLHGEGDPLKCSICGKLCRDANEFLIHH